MNFATEPVNRKTSVNPRNRTALINNKRKAPKSARSKASLSIPIPKNGRKNEVRTAKINSSRDFTKGNDLKIDANPKISLQNYLIDELSSLINACKNFNDYPIIKILTDIHPQPPNPLSIQKKKALNDIHQLVADSNLLNSLPIRVYSDLVEMIKIHLFRPIPKFPEVNEFIDNSQNYIVKNWDHIEIIHNILHILMKDVNLFGKFIDREFAFNLVAQLDSTAYEECNAIEYALSTILINFVGHRQDVLHFLLSRIISYLDGINYYTQSIPAILRLFLDYFYTLPIPINQNNFLLFRTVFYPLFSTDLSYLFEKPLHQLSSFFQQLEPATALWCLYYLKRHWPRASTAKQMMFIHQFELLLPTLPSTILEKVGPAILKILSTCICSQNFRVTIYATALASDDDFISVYLPTPDLLTDILLPAANESKEHWNEEERDLAIRLFDKISNFHFKSKTQTRAISTPSSSRKDRSENKPIGWSDIIELASSFDPSINADEYKKKLNEFAAKCANDQLISS